MSVVATRSGAEVSVVSGDLGLSFIDGDPTTVIDVESVAVEPVPSRKPNPLVRAARALLGFLRRVARTVIRVVSHTYVVAVSRFNRALRAHVIYRPRHAVKRTWYSRQRSTSQYNNARRAQAKEDELRYPREFIGLLENFIETLRYEQDTMHPSPPGRHFICS
jgi:hypothetical protein